MGALNNIPLSVRLIPNAKFKFRRNEINEGINQRNFKGALKVPWVNPFIKLHCYLIKVFEWGPPNPY